MTNYTNYTVVKCEKLSKRREPRYIVVDKETGEVLDDAQGYGYRSVEGAYAAYGYKTRDKSKDKEKLEKRRKIRKWLKEHKDFCDRLDIMAWDEWKGSGSPDFVVNAANVGKLLKESGYEVDFTPGELIKVWQNLDRRKYFERI